MVEISTVKFIGFLNDSLFNVQYNGVGRTDWAS